MDLVDILQDRINGSLAESRTKSVEDQRNTSLHCMVGAASATQRVVVSASDPFSKSIYEIHEGIKKQLDEANKEIGQSESAVERIRLYANMKLTAEEKQSPKPKHGSSVDWPTDWHLTKNQAPSMEGLDTVMWWKDIRYKESEFSTGRRANPDRVNMALKWLARTGCHFHDERDSPDHLHRGLQNL